MRDDWRETTLGEIAELSMGKTPPRNDPRYWSGSDLTRPFCTIADMVGRTVLPHREGVSELAETEGKAKRVPAGSLLMSFKLTIGRVGFAGADLFPNEAIVWIQLNDPTVQPDYLALWLSHLNLEQWAGMAVKGKTLNGTSLRSLPVQVPSLANQRRIVDLISAVDEAIDATVAVQEALAFTRFIVTKEWLSSTNAPAKRLSDLTTVVQGSSLAKSLQGTRTGDIPWYKISDMTAPENEYGYNRAETMVDEVALTNNRGRLLPIGTVVFPRVGAAVLTEKKRLLQVAGACDENHLCVLPSEALVPSYTLAFFEDLRLSDLVRTGAVPSMNQGLIRDITIPHPSPNEQRRLGEVTDSLRNQEFAAKQLRKDLDQLRSSLVDDLLDGNHEIPDSYDELLSA